ncbi:nuclear transport factor 2 family protein [Parahaliea mediterranea]|uniref:nuclear transport factor 2 family protein n=1 Tax=Parahaliea mediterranea TaxID=651086 RepID=UPI000E2FCFE3|nr:nuclear transport factor 2 family protein [Parahaliea mediterranea]
MLEATDYIAIQNLIHSYPKRLDAGDLTGVGKLFVNAAVYFEGEDAPVRNDPAEITRRFSEFLQLYNGVPRTRHVVVNLMIDPVSPDRVEASSTVVVFQQTPALPLQPIITGDYQDVFERVSGVWRFAERHISNDLYGNLSAHGRFAIGPRADDATAGEP